MASKRSNTGKSGKYWQYFELVSDPVSKRARTVCQLCPNRDSLAFHGNTSSMNNHLKGKYNIVLGDSDKSDASKRVPGKFIDRIYNYIIK